VHHVGQYQIDVFPDANFHVMLVQCRVGSYDFREVLGIFSLMLHSLLYTYITTVTISFPHIGILPLPPYKSFSNQTYNAGILSFSYALFSYAFFYFPSSLFLVMGVPLTPVLARTRARKRS